MALATCFAPSTASGKHRPVPTLPELCHSLSIYFQLPGCQPHEDACGLLI
jgi:hypothetical protein